MEQKTNPWMVSTVLLIGIIVGFGGTKLLPDSTSQAALKIAAQNNAAQDDGGVQPPTPKKVEVEPVNAKDHVRGSKSPKVTLIEYSDTECPFCRIFHPEIKKVAAAHAQDVQWVYRHFPLDELHEKARPEAEAAECAAELGGDEKFWAFLDRLLEVTPSNDGLDSSELPKIAEYVGLNRTAFEACTKSGKYADRVNADVQSGVKAGIRGTPHTIVIMANGEKIPLSGALPAEKLEKIVQQALSAK